MDEIREELVWAVRNDKFACPGQSQLYVATSLGNGEHADMLDDEEADDDPLPLHDPTPSQPAKTTLFD